MLRSLLLAALVSAMVTTGATAQVPDLKPLGPPPTFFQVAAVDADNLTIVVMRTVQEQRVGTRTVQVGDKQVQQQYAFVVEVPVAEMRKMPARDARLVTADGKKLDLSKAAGRVVAVAPTPDGLGGYRELFAADALVLILPQQQPGGPAPPQKMPEPIPRPRVP
jgi:hypothetical protein